MPMLSEPVLLSPRLPLPELLLPMLLMPALRSGWGSAQLGISMDKRAQACRLGQKGRLQPEETRAPLLYQPRLPFVASAAQPSPTVSFLRQLMYK